jgi:hypothetical protein
VSDLDRIRSLEAALERRRADRAALDALVADARADAERLLEGARGRGEAAALRHRELRLAAAGREAARLRAEADETAAGLREAAERRRGELAVALAAAALPGARP